MTLRQYAFGGETQLRWQEVGRATERAYLKDWNGVDKAALLR